MSANAGDQIAVWQPGFMASGGRYKSRGLVLVLSSLATTAAVVTLAAALTSSSGDTSASAATTLAHGVMQIWMFCRPGL
jgi:hypothetical protein